MNKKQIFLWILCAGFLIYGLFDYIDYKKKNFDVTGFILNCSGYTCNIHHRKANGEIKYTEHFNIREIERFYTQLETIPRQGGEGLVIYADRKNGTSFRLSPIYIRPSKYVEKELIKPLNKKIKYEPVNINISFPR